MILWGAIAILSVLAIIYVMRPLVSAQGDVAESATSLSVYRSQLAEVDADLARGIISPSEADAARIEIKRRILGSGKMTDTAHDGRLPLPVSIAGAAVCLALAIGLYLHLGRPSLPGQPYTLKAEQEALSKAVVSEFDAMLAKLEAHLEANPDDVEALKAMGWAQMRAGKPEKAIPALRKAVGLAPKDGQQLALFGETLVEAAAGKVSDEAMDAFNRVLAIDAKDPRGRYYKGLRLSQSGEQKAALDLWILLIKDSPKDAEWLPQVRKQAQDLALKLKIDPKTVP